MKKKAAFNVSLVSAVLAMALAGCGGGSSSTTSSAGSSTISGVITGFGSVYVNGVEYETDGASISLDGQGGSEQELGVGMVVTLQGSSSGTTGTATSIAFVDELEGVVVANNVAVDGTLDVMGRTVSVDAGTVFDAEGSGIISIEGITAGNVVEVSGYPAADGTILATRIEVKALDVAAYQLEYPGEDFEMKGVVSNLNEVASSFVLGSVTVDYSNVSSMPVLSDDLYVEVKSDAAPVGGVLAATEIELEDDGVFGIQGGDGEEIVIQGLVSDISNLPASFGLNGQTVHIGSEYTDEDFDLTTLVVGTELTIEGYFDANGDLWLDDIEEEMEGNLEFEGVVEAVDVAAGSVTMFGQSFTIDADTMMLDEEGTNTVFYFGIDDIQVGDYLEVHIYQDPQTGALKALRLERDDNPSLGAAAQEVKLSGLIDSADDATFTFTIAGISVEWDGTSVEAWDPLTTPMPQVGNKAELLGTYAAGLVTATKLQYE